MLLFNTIVKGHSQWPQMLGFFLNSVDLKSVFIYRRSHNRYNPFLKHPVFATAVFQEGEEEKQTELFCCQEKYI